MKTALQPFMIRTAVVQKYQSRQTLSSVFFLLIGLAMNSLTPTIAEASDHIQVIREVLLEAGHVVDPHALAQTKNGGYVVVGQLHKIPWATRTDASGNVQWRYVIDMPDWKPGAPLANYESVVALKDDSALLCGWKDI